MRIVVLAALFGFVAANTALAGGGCSDMTAGVPTATTVVDGSQTPILKPKHPMSEKKG